jgi:MoaE-MoaD fusion protein
MTMRVLFFAHLKDAAGCHEAELKLAAPMDSDELWRQLIGRFPALANSRSSARLARNGEYAAPNARFTDADEVALIPPVSGG